MKETLPHRISEHTCRECGTPLQYNSEGSLMGRLLPVWNQDGKVAFYFFGCPECAGPGEIKVGWA